MQLYQARSMLRAALLLRRPVCDRGFITFRKSLQPSFQTAKFVIPACANSSSRVQFSTASPAAVSLKDLESTLGPLSTTPTVPPAKPLVVVISGPSGVGKDAVIQRLQQKRPDLYFVVTATSRPMRPGERDGVDYFFVTREKFEEWMNSGVLLEHALVYGEYKGIPKQQVTEALERGTDVMLRIDVQGSDTIKKLLPGTVSIFLVAETDAELVQRLVARKTEPLDKMVLRVQTAKEETSRLGEFDYVVVNREGQLEATVEQIEAILIAEKARVERRLT